MSSAIGSPAKAVSPSTLGFHASVPDDDVMYKVVLAAVTARMLWPALVYLPVTDFPLAAIKTYG
jgi:hypothetical protein